ncbi:MAG: hypothetical protein LBT59_27960 [Clostridiales bacterium]|jgi:hypothetical protein|nr:hypothetical protein [Clostridiales bacterium]
MEYLRNEKRQIAKERVKIKREKARLMLKKLEILDSQMKCLEEQAEFLKERDALANVSKRAIHDIFELSKYKGYLIKDEKEKSKNEVARIDEEARCINEAVSELIKALEMARQEL